MSNMLKPKPFESKQEFAFCPPVNHGHMVNQLCPRYILLPGLTSGPETMPECPGL